MISLLFLDEVQHKKPTAGSLDGWGWRDLKALPVTWLDWLAVILRIELDGVWPDGLLDAYIALIPLADGDATPLGHRPFCALSVVYRLWASVRFRHFEDWLRSWLPSSVYSACGGRSCVEAWYSTALDIEEVLSGFSDTVDRGVFDYVLERLGLPVWFRKAYFGYHAGVRLRFKLSCGLGEPILQGCPLSMVLIVALYLPWCRASSLFLEFNFSYMRTTLSAFLALLLRFLVLLGLLIYIFDWLERRLLLRSVFCSAPLRRLGVI